MGFSVVSIVMQINSETPTIIENNSSRRAEIRMLPQPINTLGLLIKNDREILVVGFADNDKSSLLTTLALTDETPILKRIEASKNPIDNYIEDRLTAGEFLGTTFSQDIASEKKYQFQCFGMAVSPLGDYIAFLHSIVPDGQLRYPILSNLRYRISFLVLTDYDERLSPEKITVPLFATQHSPIAFWWKIRAISKSLRSKQRANYIEAVSEQFYNKGSDGFSKTGVDEIDDSKTLEEHVATNLFMSASVENLRLYSHLTTSTDTFPRLILDKIALTVLRYLQVVAPADSLTSAFDKAIVLSYCQALLTSPNKSDKLFVDTANSCLEKFGFDPEVPATSTLAIPGDGFEETFNFLAADDMEVINSERGHAWRRCSTTLLPLTHYHGKTCSGCGRPIVGISDMPPDEVGELIKSIFRAIDICIYCGCRFMKN